MNELPNLMGESEEKLSLRVQARLNEIGRRTSALKSRLEFLRWLVLPILGLALVGMTIGLLLGFGEPIEVVGGMIGIAGGGAGFVHWVRQLRDEVSDLEEERASVLGNLPAPSAKPGGLIGRAD